MNEKNIDISAHLFFITMEALLPRARPAHSGGNILLPRADNALYFGKNSSLIDFGFLIT